MYTVDICRFIDLTADHTAARPHTVHSSSPVYYSTSTHKRTYILSQRESRIHSAVL